MNSLLINYLASMWRYVKTVRFTENMNVQLQNDLSAAVFSNQLYEFGNETIPVDPETRLLSFPKGFCTMLSMKNELVAKVFPNFCRNYLNFEWVRDRAILAAKNKDDNALNYNIQNLIPENVHTYKSVDSVTDPDRVVNFLIEFLNSLDLPGLPPFILQLKVSSIIIILRNLN